jgi:adenine-specific DNA methylase
MEKYGKYSLETQEYERYRKTGNKSKTIEFLHVLEKSSQS